MMKKFNLGKATGISLSVSIGAGFAIGAAENNVPAGTMFAAAFVIVFSLLATDVKHNKVNT